MPAPYVLLRPLLMSLPPEAAHRITIIGLRTGFGRLFAGRFKDSILNSRLFGLDFPAPIGIAAGFDKNAEVPDAALRLGFGFAEVGSVTPRPQTGNPRPRLFRLTEDGAVINRMGFNNDGAKRVAQRLSMRQRKGRTGIVGVNIGANKDSNDRVADYVDCIEILAGLASYFVINVSSPNTPGLRGLQDREPLERLLAEARQALDRQPSASNRHTPLLLKISPDLDSDALESIAEVCLNIALDGVILTNSTLERPPELTSPNSREAGGLSGRPLFERSSRVLSEFYRLTKGRIPLIGVGGISSGEDAYAKIRCGASLVQLYTALVFEGPGLADKINRDLARLLRRDGFASVSDAVGANCR